MKQFISLMALAMTAFSTSVYAGEGAKATMEIPKTTQEAATNHNPGKCPAGYERTTIFIGIDAFRYDTIDRYDMKNLKAVAASGVRNSMRPRFPSLTNVNFYAIATGLNPEDNGVVGNQYYAPDLGDKFNYKSWYESKWWGGEPIWQTLQKQGGLASVSGWISSDAGEGDRRPYINMTFTYYNTLSHDDRLKILFHALDLPQSTRPQLINLYHDDIDHNAHTYGVNTPQEAAAAARIDAMIGKLMDGLRERKLDDCVNVIIAGDHGMVSTSEKTTIYAEDLLKEGTYRKDVLGAGPYLQVWPIGVSSDDIIKNLPKNIKGFTAYKKEDLPERFHIKNNVRTAPVILVADSGYKICPRSYEKCVTTVGMHGYDNNVLQMQATFVAHGPAFKPGTSVKDMDNIDIHPLMEKLLQIKPVKDDADICHLKAVLTIDLPECKIASAK